MQIQISFLCAAVAVHNVFIRRLSSPLFFFFFSFIFFPPGPLRTRITRSSPGHNATRCRSLARLVRAKAVRDDDYTADVAARVAVVTGEGVADGGPKGADSGVGVGRTTDRGRGGGRSQKEIIVLHILLLSSSSSWPSVYLTNMFSIRTIYYNKPQFVYGTLLLLYNAYLPFFPCETITYISAAAVVCEVPLLCRVRGHRVVLFSVQTTRQQAVTLHAW